ncbi:transposase [Oscillatoria salina]|uniref:transposase n=1 Tax=Oscillatoria salina TaxID=331517 RepID=UPI001CCAF9EE|nr:transposase [Oscillatoria salina]
MNYDPHLHKRRSIRLKGYDYSQPGAYFVTICVNQRLPLLGKIENTPASNRGDRGGIAPTPASNRGNRGGIAPTFYPSEAGEMVQTVWNEIPEHYPGVELDAFVVMPDHIHGIIILTGNHACRGSAPVPTPASNWGNQLNRGDEAIANLGNQSNRGNHGGIAPTVRGNQSNRGNHGGIAPTPASNRGDRGGIAPTWDGLNLGDVVHRFKSLTTTKYRHGVYERQWQPFLKRFWQRNYYEHIIRNQKSLAEIRDYIYNNPFVWEYELDHLEKYHPPLLK